MLANRQPDEAAKKEDDSEHKAKVPNDTGKVGLWLGANVMVEYDYKEALTLSAVLSITVWRSKERIISPGLKPESTEK